jgi:hypothetical protein
VPAEEGELGVLAKSSRHAGTSPDELAAAVNRRFAQDGIRSAASKQKTLDELRISLPALTVIHWQSILYHWVAVLDVNDTTIRFADPLSGLCELSRGEFEERWEHESVRIWRVQ